MYARISDPINQICGHICQSYIEYKIRFLVSYFIIVSILLLLYISR
jgi:hypothetical protein